MCYNLVQWGDTFASEIKNISIMKRKTAHPNEYVSFDTIAELFEQELEDARDEHSRLSDLLCKYIGDDDVYILEYYVDDLQEYIDDLENLILKLRNIKGIESVVRKEL